MRSILLAMLLAGIPFAAQAGKAIEYTADGETYEGYFAEPVEESNGLVVIIHDWDGLTAYEEQRAEMIADYGFDAFAVDLFGKGSRPTTTDEKKEATGALYNDRKKLRQLIAAGLEAARQSSQGRMIVIGYCFGGAAALELARSGTAKDAAGYAIFHGGLATPDGQTYPGETPPLLIAHGGADESVPIEEVTSLQQQLEKAGIEYEIEIYSGAPHAFTVFGEERYQERAEELSWQAFLSFLDRQLVKN